MGPGQILQARLETLQVWWNLSLLLLRPWLVCVRSCWQQKGHAPCGCNVGPAVCAACFAPRVRCWRFPRRVRHLGAADCESPPLASTGPCLGEQAVGRAKLRAVVWVAEAGDSWRCQMAAKVQCSDSSRTKRLRRTWHGFSWLLLASAGVHWRPPAFTGVRWRPLVSAECPPGLRMVPAH